MATKQISLLRKLTDVAFEQFDLENVRKMDEPTTIRSFEEGFKSGFDAALFLAPRCADELTKSGCPDELLMVAIMMALADIRTEYIPAGGDDEKADS